MTIISIHSAGEKFVTLICLTSFYCEVHSRTSKNLNNSTITIKPENILGIPTENFKFLTSHELTLNYDENIKINFNSMNDNEQAQSQGNSSHDSEFYEEYVGNRNSTNVGSSIRDSETANQDNYFALIIKARNESCHRDHEQQDQNFQGKSNN